MFNLFKTKPQGSQVTLQIDGMHCTSCSLNIDGELEEKPGVISASTSYAKARTEVIFDSAKISKEEIKQVIAGLEYGVTEIDHDH